MLHPVLAAPAVPQKISVNKQLAPIGCVGYMVHLPEHIPLIFMYSAGLHIVNAVPWLPEFGKNHIALRASGCKKMAHKIEGLCHECDHLRENSVLKGIIRRMTDGVQHTHTTA